MRINETNSSNKIASLKKKKGVSEADGGLFSLSTDSADSAPAAQNAQNISNIQSVLSLDALNILSQVNDEEYTQKQNIEWGKDILKQLERFKYQILNGKISHNALLELQSRINNIPINPQDHKLRGIIEEIEIRAAVELEKLKRLTNSSEM